MPTFVNLTPHPINLHLPDGGVQTFAPSGAVARAAETRVLRGTLDGVVVEEVAFGAVDGLPPQAADTFCIVSGLVLAAVPNRPDVLAPGQPVRDDAGRVVGCKGWTCTPAFAQDATPPTTPTHPSPAMSPSYRAWQAAPHVPYTTAVVPAAPVAGAAPCFPKQAEEIEQYLAACGGGLVPKYRPTQAEWGRLAEMAKALTAPRYNHMKAQITHALFNAAKTHASAALPPFAERVAEDNRTRFAAPASERMAVKSWSSTNNRFGLIITAHPRYAGELRHAGGRSAPEKVCIPGRATSRPNKVQGCDVIRVDDAENTWIYAHEVRASSPMRGARIVYMEGLQSGRHVSVLESPEGGCWQEHGYKNRSEWWMTMRNGDAVGMSDDEVLSLMGENHAPYTPAAPAPVAPVVPEMATLSRLRWNGVGMDNSIPFEFRVGSATYWCDDLLGRGRWRDNKGRPMAFEPKLERGKYEDFSHYDAEASARALAFAEKYNFPPDGCEDAVPASVEMFVGEDGTVRYEKYRADGTWIIGAVKFGTYTVPVTKVTTVSDQQARQNADLMDEFVGGLGMLSEKD